MSGQSKITTDHDFIRKWAEERQGEPSIVKGTADNGQGVGLLRINFPGGAEEESLEKITWDEFFKTFENKQLAFLYQDEIKEGSESRFFKFINRKDRNA